MSIGSCVLSVTLAGILCVCVKYCNRLNVAVIKIVSCILSFLIKLLVLNSCQNVGKKNLTNGTCVEIKTDKWDR